MKITDLDLAYVDPEIWRRQIKPVTVVVAILFDL